MTATDGLYTSKESSMTPINKLAQDIGNPAADLAATAVNLMRLTIWAASARDRPGDHIAAEIGRAVRMIATNVGHVSIALATYDVTANAESEARP
jgi:hypothetical protein